MLERDRQDKTLLRLDGSEARENEIKNKEICK